MTHLEVLLIPLNGKLVNLKSPLSILSDFHDRSRINNDTVERSTVWVKYRVPKMHHNDVSVQLYRESTHA